MKKCASDPRSMLGIVIVLVRDDTNNCIDEGQNMSTTNKKRWYWEDAQYWINKGLWVIPLNEYAKPMWKGYNTPEVALDTIHKLKSRCSLLEWQNGIGFILHLSNIVMLDIDKHKPEKNGYYSYRWLLENYTTIDH